MSEPIFLTLEQAQQIHARSLKEHGGLEGTREPGLVEAALASARNTYYYGNGDLFDIAATYAYHLAESQAFLDGNKRTAVTAALVFLAMNGLYVTLPQWELYLAMIDIAEKKMNKAQLADLLRRAAQ